MKMDFREALVLNRKWSIKGENRVMRWRLCFLRKLRGSNHSRKLAISPARGAERWQGIRLFISANRRSGGLGSALAEVLAEVLAERYGSGECKKEVALPL